jgi:hypothetical protein
LTARLAQMAKEVKFKFRLRLTTEDDLILLRDVMRHNPFEGPSEWKQIHANLLWEKFQYTFSAGTFT